MPTQTVLREAAFATAANTYAKLNGGVGTTPDDIKVPKWANSIKHIKVGMGVDGAAGSGCVLVQLRGAVKYGTQTLCLGAYTNIGTTVALAQAPMQRDVDIAVDPQGTLEIWAAVAGGDTGTPELQVELTFSDGESNHSYVTRQDALATVDTWQDVDTEDGNTATANPQVQGKRIVEVWSFVGLSPTTQEPHQVAFRLVGVDGSLFGNEHTFTTSSNLVSDGTLADACVDPGTINRVDIPVTSGQFRIQGVDSSASSTADPELGVTVVFER